MFIIIVHQLKAGEWQFKTRFITKTLDAWLQYYKGKEDIILEYESIKELNLN